MHRSFSFIAPILCASVPLRAFFPSHREFFLKPPQHRSFLIDNQPTSQPAGFQTIFDRDRGQTL